jgi:hypothetical protein
MLHMRALGGVEGAEELVLHPVHRLRDPVDHRDPLLRHLDEVAAPILRVAAPGRIAPGLELVEDRHQVGGVEMEPPAERLLRQLAMVAKLDQGRQVTGTDPVRLERLGEAVHRDPAELDHQQRRPSPRDAGRLVLDRVLWHAPKVSRLQRLVLTNHLLQSMDLPARE